MRRQPSGPTSPRTTSTPPSRPTRRAAVSSANSGRPGDAGGRSNLIVRIATAVVGIPVVLAVNRFGGPFFAGMIGAVALVSAYEMDRLLRAGHVRPLPVLPALLAVCFAVLPQFDRHPQQAWTLMVVSILFGFGALYLLPAMQDGALVGWMASVSGVLYTGLLPGTLTLLRQGDDGAWWVALVLILTWSYDSGAYFGGRLFGRHGFMTHISPKKTWEGVALGLAVSAVAGLIGMPALGLRWWHGLLLGLAVGIVVQIGDLIESMVKRQVGVKDSGALIPGHGGLLDRIDGLLFAAAVGYYASALLGYAA